MKRFHLAVAIVATVGLASAAFADDEKAARPREGKPGNFRERRLKEFDADGDGKLNEKEQAIARAAAAKLRGSAEAASRFDKAQLIEKFDKDGDGRLSEAELAAARELMAKRRAASDGNQIPAEILKRFDKDGDGKLNGQERQAAMKAREEYMKRSGATGRPGQDLANKEAFIKKFDKNGNGKLDGGELAAAREAMAKFRGAGGAGTLPSGNGSPRKPRVDKQELLEKFDADGDGKLNDEERANAVKEFKNRNKS